jgi:hypothetical protein
MNCDLPKLKSKRFIYLLPIIIEWKNKGFSAEQIILKLLREYELDLTLGTYKNYLHKANGFFYKAKFSRSKIKKINIKQTITQYNFLEETNTSIGNFVEKPASKNSGAKKPASKNSGAKKPAAKKPASMSKKYFELI